MSDLHAQDQLGTLAALVVRLWTELREADSAWADRIAWKMVSHSLLVARRRYLLNIHLTHAPPRAHYLRRTHLGEPLLAAKVAFVAELARLTATPEPVVRQRVRSLFEVGIGPSRQDPLHDSAMAAWLIGFLASPSHLEVAELVEHVGGFPCVAVDPGGRGRERERSQIDALFPGLRVTPLAGVLGSIIRGVAEKKYRVASMSADFPPHSEFRIALLIGDAPPITLVFGPGPALVRRLRKSDVWPLKQSQEMEGHVLDGLVHLATPDNVN